MLKQYQHFVGGIFRIIDAFIIGCVWLGSYFLRFYLPWIPVTKGFPPFQQYAALTPLIIILWMAVFSTMKLYKSRRMLRRTDEAWLLVKAHVVSLLIFISLTYLFSEYRYSRGVLSVFGLMGGFSLVFFRLILRNALRSIRKKGFNLRHVIAVGEGGTLEFLIQRLEKFPEIGMRVRGVVVQEASRNKKEVGGKPVLGVLDDIARILRLSKADQVLIALPRSQQAELDRVLSLIRDETIDVRLIPDIHEYVTLGCEVEDFDGLPIVNLNDSPLDGWGSVAKRITDCVLSACALLVILPFGLIIAAVVRLTSKGPVFYGQERMGLDGVTFKMWKFRSMNIDAELDSGPVWASEGDVRRTRVGSFLRATSLDELPQFWNVFVGNMSLVGPRPERPVFVDKFRKEIPHYMLRHKVKAGITGWAQVNGWRGNTSLTQRIECDLFYIKNWSYVFDFKILWLTVWRGFVNKNAY